MNKIALCCIVFFLSLEFGALVSEENRDAGTQGLKVTVLPRAFTGREYLKLGKEGEHITVLFENVSGREIRLWGGLKNGGYQNMRVRLTDESGSQSEARRALITGSEIGDASEIFKPGDKKIVEIYPGSKEWEGFPPTPETPQKYTVKIIYESKMPANDPMSWIGTVESPEHFIWLY